MIWEKIHWGRCLLHMKAGSGKKTKTKTKTCVELMLKTGCFAFVIIGWRRTGHTGKCPGGCCVGQVLL